MDIGRKLIVLILIFLIGGFLVYNNFFGGKAQQEFKNFILVGWDGVEREHLYDLLDKGQLPNLKKLVEKGAIVDTIATTASTETKPGWAEILTGYNAENLGIYDNIDYKPIPKGYTVFERLEDYFGEDTIATLFVGGKIDNIGARGPHKICVNCITRYPDTREKTFYKDEGTTAPTKRPGEERVLEDREGDPYFHTKDALDVYETALGNAANVGPKAVDYLEEYKDKRFFAFFHFEEPDELGHKDKGGSQGYLNGIMADDYWLGEIVAKLKELGVYEETLIYVTTDHGFNEGEVHHRSAPNTFLAANEKGLRNDGDRKDVAPTILYRYGIDTKAFSPPLDGVSLIGAENPVRIGYFRSARTQMIYRAYIQNYFDQEGVQARLYTGFLGETEFFEVPKSGEETRKIAERERRFGVVEGEEIADRIVAGEFDGGTLGSGSFVAAVHKGAPLVAVALLGYDASPAKSILMRKDVKIVSPDDFKGKTLISPRSGPGTAIFLREFLRDMGLDLEKDVTIIDNVYEDDAKKLLEQGKIDGGLFTLGEAESLVRSGKAYIYRPMDWMNSELSHGLLVFHTDFVKNHPDSVQKFVNGYVKRIAYEKNLAQEQGVAIQKKFQGLKSEEHSLPPRVRVDLLEEMQGLLYEYGFIDTKISMSNVVDHSFVEKAMDTQ